MEDGEKNQIMERGRREKRDQNPGSGRRKNDRTKDGIGLTERDLNHEIWKKDSGVRGNSSSQSQGEDKIKSSNLNLVTEPGDIFRQQQNISDPREVLSSEKEPTFRIITEPVTNPRLNIIHPSGVESPVKPVSEPEPEHISEEPGTNIHLQSSQLVRKSKLICDTTSSLSGPDKLMNIVNNSCISSKCDNLTASSKPEIKPNPSNSDNKTASSVPGTKKDPRKNDSSCAPSKPGNKAASSRSNSSASFSKPETLAAASIAVLSAASSKPGIKDAPLNPDSLSTSSGFLQQLPPDYKSPGSYSNPGASPSTSSESCSVSVRLIPENTKSASTLEHNPEFKASNLAIKSSQEPMKNKEDIIQLAKLSCSVTDTEPVPTSNPKLAGVPGVKIQGPGEFLVKKPGLEPVLEFEDLYLSGSKNDLVDESSTEDECGDDSMDSLGMDGSGEEALDSLGMDDINQIEVFDDLSINRWLMRLMRLGGSVTSSGSSGYNPSIRDSRCAGSLGCGVASRERRCSGSGGGRERRCSGSWGRERRFSRSSYERRSSDLPGLRTPPGRGQDGAGGLRTPPVHWRRLSETSPFYKTSSSRKGSIDQSNLVRMRSSNLGKSAPSLFSSTVETKSRSFQLLFTL
ncbi:uncharacterized protein LOC111696235 isoform X3 [Eurytemora carolleeae]|uniref:uncharacterized protein LOC111696235 isoform X3 n=1 Tax=Eurytemora carolleeae TaxID=1294199 RepID=UPI000C794A3D|nr:uncharacterized protein LOC111696235 isoform X3 [Eurytemora carolleeae]|eukprot:XP_023321553.1 uncharacterized protein LOC111696235 isoform X3 [Eurytemora affinis]